MKTQIEKFRIPSITKNILLKTCMSELFSGTAPLCTLVKAMTGFGKTSMTAKCAWDCKETVMWYTLDWTDNQADCFLEGLKTVWGFADEADGQQTAADCIEHQICMLSRQMKKQNFGKKRYMVFDNLQIISSEIVLHMMFSLIQNMEGDVSFVLLTNADVPRGFLPLKLGGKARLLTENELRISGQEAFELFGCDTRITEALCGWQLGIERTVSYLGGAGYQKENDWSVILQESLLSVYLDECFWENCPAQIQEFLKQAALLGEFSWELCRETMSGGVTRRLFEKAVSYRGIVLPVRQKKGTYRIGEAFCAYLCRMVSDDKKYALCGKETLCAGTDKKTVLEINAFGAFRVKAVRDGRELAWRTRKGRELFAYLFDMEGKAVERQTLIEALWQDEIPESAVPMLHNMIYNIRKELSAYGMEPLLVYENKRYRLKTDEIMSESDGIKELVRLVEKKEWEQLKKGYQGFLKYWGSYLGEIDSLWVEEKRRYYDEIYKRGCFILAELFEAEGEYDTSIIFCKNVLSLEPYCEKAAGKMISLYGRKREWDKMKKCYKNFSKALQNDLGIVPCEELTAVYRAHFAK